MQIVASKWKWEGGLETLHTLDLPVRATTACVHSLAVHLCCQLLDG